MTTKEREINILKEKLYNSMTSNDYKDYHFFTRVLEVLNEQEIDNLINISKELSFTLINTITRRNNVDADKDLLKLTYAVLEYKSKQIKEAQAC